MKPTKPESLARTLWVTVGIFVYFFLVALVVNAPQKPAKLEPPAYCMDALAPGIHGPCSLLKHDKHV